MSLVLVVDEAFAEHDPGRLHPECPARLAAARGGLEQAGLGDAIRPLPARLAETSVLESVHDPGLLDRLRAVDRAGGGRLDPDTAMSAASWRAARLAAGAGLVAVDALRVDPDAFGAFCAVRPPGHHATPRRAMGFCLLNNVAVTAAHLAAAGERVLVVDVDAHHGNGTQEAFYDRGDVVFVSVHEFPQYPGTGRLDERGAGSGLGATVNVPMPSGATGDRYRRVLAEVVQPLAERTRPDWLLVSLGLDAHRHDPLTSLGLSSGDYGALGADLAELVPGNRRIAFLEGGYDLDAVSDSVGAFFGAWCGVDHRPEPPSSGGPGGEVVDLARRLLDEDGRISAVAAVDDGTEGKGPT